MNQTNQPAIDTIISFLGEIGMGVHIATLNEPTLMPGISINNGAIVIDPEKLTYPGDILHEAGHVATALPENRSAMIGKLPEGFDYLGDEIAAQTWSYAACVHLGLDPRIVFHESGYHKSSSMLIRTYSSDQPAGVPLLQWMGMAYDKKNAEKLNTLAYPDMIRWLRC